MKSGKFLQTALAEQKAARQAVPKHLQLKNLTEDQRATQLNFARKHSMDTTNSAPQKAEDIGPGSKHHAQCNPGE